MHMVGLLLHTKSSIYSHTHGMFFYSVVCIVEVRLERVTLV